MPVVVSSVFDREYSKGALEGAVRLALSPGDRLPRGRLILHLHTETGSVTISH